MLDGLRVLHYVSPVRFDTSGMFQHDFDSNYKVVEKTISFLPNCHHYVVVPTKHNIPDTRDNVTFITYPYSRDLLANRSYFDGVTFRKLFDFRYMDFDFVFCHQPEMLYNILVSFNDKRYGQNMNRFLFFHWVDCTQSRASSAIPPAFMRQLEGINLCDKTFFHTDIASDWLMNNFKKQQSTNSNHQYIKDKTTTFPLSANKLDKSEPFKMNRDNVLVFNHRWAKSTGVNRMMEYTEDLPDYKVWCTDYQAPEDYVGSKLNSGQYRYLLENSLGSMCFVDNYATWNLSIQDGLSVNKPVLIYDQPAMRKVVGDNYPLFFKTKDEFQTQVKNLKNMNNFTWEVKNHDKVFHHNLLYNMKRIMDKERKHIPKDAMNWLYCILNGINYKHDIAKQVQPNIQLNSVWQYIRRYLLEIGVKDDINSPYVNYSIPDYMRTRVEDMVKDVKLEIEPTTIKRKIVTKKHNWF